MSVRLTVLGWVSLAAMLMSAVRPAAAQTGTTAAPAGQFEIAGGVTVSGSTGLGGAGADLTPNLNGAAFTLFRTSASYTAPVGGDLRMAVRIRPWLLLGVSGALSRGDVTVDVSADAEDGQTPSFDGEPLGQGLLEARLDVLFTRLRVWQGKLTPYATVSGGVLRHWHDGNVIIESGHVMQAGAGLRYVLMSRPARLLSRFGLSGEIRMTQVSGGFHWGRERRTMPSARVECFTGWGR